MLKIHRPHTFWEVGRPALSQGGHGPELSRAAPEQAQASNGRSTPCSPSPQSRCLLLSRVHPQLRSVSAAPSPLPEPWESRLHNSVLGLPVTR